MPPRKQVEQNLEYHVQKKVDSASSGIWEVYQGQQGIRWEYQGQYVMEWGKFGPKINQNPFLFHA